MTEPSTREIVLIMENGDRKIVSGIPSNAKITCSGLNPGAKEGYGRNPVSIRIYTSASNQLAVFVGVREFRDTSLTVRKQVKNSKSAAEAQATKDGTKRKQESETSYDLIED